MINDFLVISDLHLEKKSQKEQDFLLNVINTEINNRKTQGYNSIIICPGDVHEGVKGLEFLSKINTKVVYLCGNHEFWNNDYEDVRKNIKENIPSNVSFLDNDFVFINGFLFVGGTMWSDLGEKLNPDLFPKTSLTMNDEFKITHKNWYKNSKNIEKLKELYPYHENKFIENSQWNILIEREENKKSIDYLNDFIEVYLLYKSINIYENNLTQEYNSDYIDKEKYDLLIKSLMSYKNDINLIDWYQNLEDKIRYNLSKINLSNPENKNKIFQKLIKEVDIKNNPNIKLIGVSHHLPFIEERLIGKQDFYNDEMIPGYFNKVNDTIYSIRNGLDYNLTNYFYRISKGEFSKDEAITHVLHYSNDGSSNFSPNLIEEIDSWVHGHEHHYNYEDNLKGIKIITNPLGYSLSVFDFENNGNITLNNNYKRYHKITDENEKSEIQKIAESFLRKSNFELNKKNRKKAIEISLLKNFNWDDYQEEIEFLIFTNNDLFNYLNKIDKKNIKKEEIYKIRILSGSINDSFNNIIKMEEELNEGILIRNSPDYSFNLKYGHALGRSSVLDLFIPIKTKIEKLDIEFLTNDEVLYSSIERITYENLYFLNKAQKALKEIVKVLNDLDIKNINDLTKKTIDDFYEKYEEIKYNNRFSILEKNKILEDFYKLYYQNTSSNKYDF